MKKSLALYTFIMVSITIAHTTWCCVELYTQTVQEIIPINGTITYFSWKGALLRTIILLVITFAPLCISIIKTAVKSKKKKEGITLIHNRVEK